MARGQAKPLTPEEAKLRLRRTARNAGFSAWVRRKPLRAVALGLAAGVILGSSPRTRDLIIRTLIQTI
jgi:hypothetical protein